MDLAPGSQMAGDLGCSCPVMDNAGGRGVRLNDEVFFWINSACPVHGLQLAEAARNASPQGNSGSTPK